MCLDLSIKFGYNYNYDCIKEKKKWKKKIVIVIKINRLKKIIINVFYGKVIIWLFCNCISLINFNFKIW